ncbi:MAG: DNA polymerase III subunit gamma/tau [Erysipelotrichaceae bacterium]|nr:DNA polymerase III subunit gamma/tau [Erysipelotrichaceae bacterium]
MAYQVLYRTYRPARFDEVVGQDYIVKTLKNAIKLNKIAHAYLFAGPRGTGKTTIAKLFAKAINCPDFNEEACDNCDSCKAFVEGNHPDIIEMDAASNNGVDDIRRIVEEIPYAPILGKYKVYIIDEAHMLTANAFNALLKTLEEPPEHVIFILATTDPQKVIPTVLSRCQRYNFSKISNLEIKNKMIEILKKENIEYEEKALEEVAILAEGGMRDALSILEQILSYNANGVHLEDVEKIFGLSSTEEKVNLLINTHSQNIDEVISLLRQMYQSGIDMKRLSIDLLEIVKETLIYSERGSDVLLNKITAPQAQDILNLTGVKVLLEDIEHLEECLSKTHGNQNFVSYLELCLIKMAGNKTSSMSQTRPIEKVVVKNEPKQEPKQEKAKEEEKDTKEDIINLVVEDDKKDEPLDLNYIARLLVWASKQDKINDAVIYNRLELYKFDPDNRKYYELLNGSELFASSSDAIIITANKDQAASINSPMLNEDLFNFINHELGIDKMIFAVDENNKRELIEKYKNLSEEDKSERPVVKKYEVRKIRTTEDKLKELFENVEVK